MTAPTMSEFDGRQGRIATYTWSPDDARYLVLLLHGYGEHLGRYQHVAEALTAHGALVVGPDHLGHGRSDGERALVESIDTLLADAHTVWQQAHDAHPDLPTVLIGHSMGGHLGARYALAHGNELAAAVLSAPVIGRMDIVEQLLGLPEIPDMPLPPEALSRDPAVGAAYAADDLVWHGPFKRPTLEAFRDSNQVILAGGTVGDLPLLWIHGENDPIVPREGSQVGIASMAGSRTEERSYPGGMHESFNETNQDEILGDVTEFVDRVLFETTG